MPIHKSGRYPRRERWMWIVTVNDGDVASRGRSGRGRGCCGGINQAGRPAGPCGCGARRAADGEVIGPALARGTQPRRSGFPFHPTWAHMLLTLHRQTARGALRGGEGRGPCAVVNFRQRQTINNGRRRGSQGARRRECRALVPTDGPPGPAQRCGHGRRQAPLSSADACSLPRA